MVPFSFLDLVNVNQGETPRDALMKSLDLARHAEALGYQRYWVAEHHNMPNIASAATSVVIGYLAAGTETIRLGSGGIMLPNHPTLVVAEQFGTLASLYPNRIDLGLGRAPGTDAETSMALRRDQGRVQDFPEEIRALQAYFAPATEGQRVQAVPGAGLNVPLWILGSSTYGASVAASFGLPYSYAAHFVSDSLFDAIDVYRREFKPSPQLAKPHFMLCVNVIAAETDRQAQRLFTTLQQGFVNLLRGKKALSQPSVEDINSYWSPAEAQQISRMLKYSIVGSAETVQRQLKALLTETAADEIMITAPIFDHQSRLRSLEITAGVMHFQPEL